MSARKKCTRCRQTKGVGEFREYRSRGKAYRYGACRECERETAARWRAENRERKREYAARWRAENRERERERVARWRASPEGRAMDNARSARRRARKAGLPDDGSDVSDWLWQHEETDVWYCHLCGGAFAAGDEIHWDHRDPVSTGTAGTVLSNMAAAHAACNISRGNTPLREWHKHVGLPDGVV